MSVPKLDILVNMIRKEERYQLIDVNLGKEVVVALVNSF